MCVCELLKVLAVRTVSSKWSLLSVQLFKWGVGYQRRWSIERLWPELVRWYSVMCAGHLSLWISLFMSPRLQFSHSSCQTSTSIRTASRLSCITNSLSRLLSFHWSKEVKSVENFILKKNLLIYLIFVQLWIFQYSQNIVWKFNSAWN